jgi:hypothetical protein
MFNSTAVNPNGVDSGTGASPRASAREALDRTMRLMRDDLRADVSDEVLLTALLGQRARLVADATNLASPAAQTAFVATTLLLLRSGTSVVLDAPEVNLIGAQPPLRHDKLLAGLLEVGTDLIEGVSCVLASASLETAGADTVVIVFGDSPCPRGATLTVRIWGDSVSATMIATSTDTSVSTLRPKLPTLSPSGAKPWDPATRIPFGGLVAAGLVAVEAYKIAMRSLRTYALSVNVFDELFAVSPFVLLSLDPSSEVDRIALSSLRDLGAIDAISGGAIVQAFLFAIARMPGVRARVRVLEPERADASNLNRYALLLRSLLEIPKAAAIATLPLGGVSIIPIQMRYDRTTPLAIGGHADAVIVGVDHIPTRWAAQKARAVWLGIGATSHYSAMSSEHVRGAPCAWCLHPSDAPDLGPIPTVAFVSHWAGVLIAWRLVRHRLGLRTDTRCQYDYLTPLRTDLPGAMWRSPIAAKPDCPNGCTPRPAVA